MKRRDYTTMSSFIFILSLLIFGVSAGMLTIGVLESDGYAAISGGIGGLLGALLISTVLSDGNEDE